MQRYRPPDPAIRYFAIVLCSAAVFVADLFTPLGTTVWIFYLVPMAATLLMWRPTAPLALAAAQTILSVIGLFVSPPGADADLARLNRLFGIATMWIVGVVAWQFIRGRLAVRKEEWLQTGRTRLAAAISGEQTLEQLGDNILRTLAEYLGACAGAIFTRENGSFRRSAGYAFGPNADAPTSFAPGEGLLGQAVKDGRPFVVSEIPEGYVTVASGLGHSRPRHLLIAPALVDGEANSVLEFAFFDAVDEASQELLIRVSEAIAMTVRSVRYRVQLEELLEETQRQAEELQVQSEELRASNEELEQQRSALEDSQSRLEQQQMELEQTNARLQEQANELETQRDALLTAKKTLEKQAEELQIASRYKSEFLASMSHELRTPLNSALILARLLFENREGNLTPKQAEYARSIEASCNALLELINEVLDLAKVEAGRMDLRFQNVSVAKLTESLRSMFQPLAEQKGLYLRIEVDADVPESLETDPQRVEQVLKNLLANAVKFTDRGGVTLKISRRSDGRLEFAVHDTGIGIAEDQRQTIFEPFRQIESSIARKYGGTGLGLSISRELMRLLGGEIEVRSALGEGSTFTVVLDAWPNGSNVTREYRLAQAASAGADASVFTPQTVQTSGPIDRDMPHIEDDRDQVAGEQRVILIVEDDEVFAYILRDLARELKFKCLIATTAAEARSLAARYLPSALILDIGLPDNSGLALLDALKRDTQTRHIPVHVVSAHDHADTALSLGAIGYVLKPVKREQLIEAFRKLESRLTRGVRRVLIVEDDPVQSESLGELLGSPEVETVHAGTAAECLRHLQESVFDCMVLDLSLPDASGFALLETISREDRYSFPPAIIYTGRDLSEDEEHKLRRYSSSIIIKGAKSPERLLDEVTLFLHQVVEDMPSEKRRLLDEARRRDAVLEGRRILVAEDDVRNVYALTSLLEPHGVKVEIARNGREALEALERASGPDGKPIDLVLMDVMMPEMDGLTATAEIRRRPEWSKLPIIALTAKAMRNDREQILNSGVSDYMAKPLDVEQLLSLIRIWMPR